MPKQDLANLVNFFYENLMLETAKSLSKNLMWLYFINNKKQSAFLICTIICIVSHYSNKRKAMNSGGNIGQNPTPHPSSPTANSPPSTSLLVQSIVNNEDNSDPGAELAHEPLMYIGTLLILTALFCLTVEVVVGGTGLVIGIWGLSLAIEHVIAGLLVIGTSCFGASAGVHYVYELSVEKNKSLTHEPSAEPLNVHRA